MVACSSSAMVMVHLLFGVWAIFIRLSLRYSRAQCFNFIQQLQRQRDSCEVDSQVALQAQTTITRRM